MSSPPGGALPSGHQKGSPLPASVLSVCGSASAVFGTVFSMPFDVARTRLVAQSYNKVCFSFGSEIFLYLFINLVQKDFCISLFGSERFLYLFINLVQKDFCIYLLI